MLEKIKNNQNGAVMLAIVFMASVIALSLAALMLANSMGLVKFSRENLDAWNTIDTWESCASYFNKLSDRSAQISGCTRGGCLDLSTNSGCVACGDSASKLSVGNCYCQIEFAESTGNQANFNIAGFCNQAKYVSQATLTTCEPDCAGKECGDDGCGGSCGVCSTGGSCINGLCQ